MHFFNTYCNNIPPSIFTSYKSSLSFTFLHQNPACVSHLRRPHASTTSPPSCITLTISVQMYTLWNHYITIFCSPLSSSHIGPYIFISSLFSNNRHVLPSKWDMEWTQYMIRAYLGIYINIYSYTGCFTTLGHNCRRWFPRSLWWKKFI